MNRSGWLRSSLVGASVVALVGAFACADSSTCPGGSQLVAAYNVSYTAIDGGDTCIVTSLPDGGPYTGLLVSTPATSALNLCATPVDGGAPVVYLQSNQLYPDAGGTLGTTGISTDVAGSACTCPIDIQDTISITLTTADGGPFAFNGGDAGFTPVTGFTGSLNYGFAESSDSTVLCTCNVPCGAHYTLSGAP